MANRTNQYTKVLRALQRSDNHVTLNSLFNKGIANPYELIRQIRANGFAVRRLKTARGLTAYALTGDRRATETNKRKYEAKGARAFG